MSMAEALGISDSDFENAITKKSDIPFNNCEGCEYWEEFTWACCNGDSPHRADFVNEGCKFKVCKEGKNEKD